MWIQEADFILIFFVIVRVQITHVDVFSYLWIMTWQQFSCNQMAFVKNQTNKSH